jgi:hypothetical protein
VKRLANELLLDERIEHLRKLAGEAPVATDPSVTQDGPASEARP